MSEPSASNVIGDIKTLIVMYDGSHVAGDALPVVRQLAERTGAAIRLMTSTLGGEGATVQRLVEAEAELDGLDVGHIIVDDRPAAEAAIDVALSTDGGLLCLSTHGRSGLGRAVLGSVADGVIRSGLVPVLVVGPSCDEDALDGPGPVALCVDGSERSDRVLEEGLHWARLLGRDARMVLVSNPFDGVTRQEATETFDRIGSRHESPEVHLTACDAVNGSVAWGLVTEAEMVKAPLMVIAPAARSRWERLLIGSTTLAVLRSAKCPVLVLAGDATERAST
jgi:nucleotide-binding universal stress UspA family protein